VQGDEEKSRHNDFAVSSSIAEEVKDVASSTVALVPQSGDFVMVQEKVMFNMLPNVTVSATMRLRFSVLDNIFVPMSPYMYAYVCLSLYVWMYGSLHIQLYVVIGTNVNV